MEGPTVSILKEAIQPFIKQKITAAEGYAKIDLDQLTGKKLERVETWGKHFLFTVGDTRYRAHFMLFGSYAINDQSPRNPTLRMRFPNGVVNFYMTDVRLLPDEVYSTYDWRVDVMSDEWDVRTVTKRIKQEPKKMLNDVLMDQNMFAGVGNIIKNETLSIVRLHPETRVETLTPAQITKLAKSAHDYSWKFFDWKKGGVLKKRLTVYHQTHCPHCSGKLTVKETGKESKRHSYFCPKCPPKAPARSGK